MKHSEFQMLRYQCYKDASNHTGQQIVWYEIMGLRETYNIIFPSARITKMGPLLGRYK